MGRHEWGSADRPCRIIGEQLRAMIRRAVEVAEPNGREICGLILDNGYLLELLPVKNQTRAPGSFSISWMQWRKARKAARRLGHRVVGTYHSHPVSEAAPGPADLRFAQEGDLMLIFSCWDLEARLWLIRKGEAQPLRFCTVGEERALGRPVVNLTGGGGDLWPALIPPVSE